MVESAMVNIPTNKDQLKNYSGAFLLSDDLFHKALNFIAKAKNVDGVCFFYIHFLFIVGYCFCFLLLKH
jgi:hypothetical protein